METLEDKNEFLLTVEFFEALNKVLNEIIDAFCLMERKKRCVSPKHEWDNETIKFVSFNDEKYEHKKVQLIVHNNVQKPSAKIIIH